MKRNPFIINALASILVAALFFSCSKTNDPERVVPEKKRPVITDESATAKTKALYENLIDLMDKGTMFGAQIPTEYGLDGGKKWVDED